MADRSQDTALASPRARRLQAREARASLPVDDAPALWARVQVASPRLIDAIVLFSLADRAMARGHTALERMARQTAWRIVSRHTPKGA